METIILITAFFFMGVFVVTGLMMTNWVAKHGVKINIPFIRLYFPFYIHKYRQITRRETGKTGPLFYPGIISINAALILVLLYIFV